MGLDQDRGQITTKWLDTATGEVGRARVPPARGVGLAGAALARAVRAAHREPVRRFLSSGPRGAGGKQRALAQLGHDRDRAHFTAAAAAHQRAPLEIRNDSLRRYGR